MTRRTRCHGCDQSRDVREMIAMGRKNYVRCAYCVERRRERELGHREIVRAQSMRQVA